MALKLGKCRLCLKLGDFYSIFTVDNALQLAEMVMECTRVKVYEGDGLPDKVCSECIQKLSGAYIFKQQCERSDQELRRNYVPPPGFSETPPPPNRQSSDSAFSSHTDISSQTKPSSSAESRPGPRVRKMSRGSADDVSISSRSQEYTPTTKRVSELRNPAKRRCIQSNSNSHLDSDYEDNNSISHYSVGETDSDEPLLKTEHKCQECSRVFNSLKSLAVHSRVHSRKDKVEKFGKDEVVNIPKNDILDAIDDEDKLSCNKCGKTFKLKIMLKRHHETCSKTPVVSPRKQLLISLEPIDGVHNKKIGCDMCSTKFKTIENLEKHMRVVHAAVLKKERLVDPQQNGRPSVPCIYCQKLFVDYYEHSAHFSICSEKEDASIFECPICKKVSYKKSAYLSHIKNVHFEPRPVESSPMLGLKQESLECRMCSERLPTQDQLITHLAAHMSNLDEPTTIADNDSRDSSVDDAASDGSVFNSSHVSSGPLSCDICDRKFKYKKALETHKLKHTENQNAVKLEPPDNDNMSGLLCERTRPKEETDSSQDEGDDNTCEICEKQFSYKRLLIHHKRTKHTQCAGVKRAKINLKDCSVRCLICDVEMKVSVVNEHNQKHITANVKPRNLYSCGECGEKFKSCSGLANHIKFIHRLKQAPKPKHQKVLPGGSELADFCEVVVTKAEPLDILQSHNGFGEVPDNENPAASVNLSGFTCPICQKQMPTLISLKRHVNWHSNVGKNMEKQIECFVCKETFRFQCHYKLHMRDHYKDTNLDPKYLTCSICNRKSKHLRAAQMHMNFHKQTRFKSKDYQCSICKKIFQYRKVYLSHMAIHFKRGESIQNTVVGHALPDSVNKEVFDGTHSCHLCGKVCDSDNSLKCHIRWHSSKSSLFGARHECYICNLQFTNKRRLELHTRTHYEDENGPYKCSICGKGFIDEGYYRRHVKGHNFDHQSHKDRIDKLRKDKVKCPICARFYPDLIRLIRHLRRTHPESKMIKSDPDAPAPIYYSCKLCAKVFLDERRLRLHEEAHLRKPLFFKCKFCGKNTISMKNHNVHIKAHLTRNYFDNPLKCTQCDETFVRGYDLHHHLRDVHNIKENWIAERTEQSLEGPLKELQCAICLKVLASKGNYERHIDYHNSLRCNYCFDYFSTLRFLEGHLAFSCEKKKLLGDTEVYPRKIKCHICYKAFHVQVKLDCHLRIKHDIKVFKKASSDQKETVCDYCFRVFENEDALLTHKIYHRTVGFYGCIYCKRKFGTLTVYRKHKNHHFSQINVENPYKCEHCDEKFVAFREMIYHMRDVHGDDKEWTVMPKDSIEETCHICNKTFFNLHKHLTYHEENRCKKCAEYFFSRADFDNHLCAIESDDETLQTGENTLVPVYEECRFCFKPVTRSKSKRLHDNMHRTSGAISCRFCTLKFKTIDAFNIHAFSHRNRKYHKKPLKCRKCGEKFVKYGPFMKHLKHVHNTIKKVHYRAVVKPERCVVCGDDFPNLHNHYRAHLLNQCQLCRKYFTSAKVFSNHVCDKEDSDPTKVFVCDENLIALINSYVPKDLKDDEKFYGHSDNEDEEEIERPETNNVGECQAVGSSGAASVQVTQNKLSQDEKKLHLMVSSPIISDVLSLYEEDKKKAADVVDLADDDSMDVSDINIPIITID